MFPVFCLNKNKHVNINKEEQLIMGKALGILMMNYPKLISNIDTLKKQKEKHTPSHNNITDSYIHLIFYWNSANMVFQRKKNNICYSRNIKNNQKINQNTNTSKKC